MIGIRAVILTYEYVPDYNPLGEAPVGMVDTGPDRVVVPVMRSPEIEYNIAAVAVGDILLPVPVDMFVVLAVAVAAAIGAVQLDLV